MAEIKYGIASDLAAARSLVENIEKLFESTKNIELDEAKVVFSSSSFSGRISQIKGGAIEYNIKNENDEYCPVSKDDFIKRAAQYEALILEGARKDISDGLLRLEFDTERNKTAEILDTEVKEVTEAPEIEEKPVKREKVQEIEKDKDKDREEKGPTLEELVAEKEKNDEEIIPSNPQIDPVR